MNVRYGAVFLLCSAVLAAQQPRICNLGTTLAVDPKRQLAPGEETVNVRGGVVKLDQRESRNSTRIVSVLCMLPPDRDTPIMVGGVVPWVKICGNNFEPQGWNVPLASWQKPKEPTTDPPKPEPKVETKVESDKPVNVTVNLGITIPPPDSRVPQAPISDQKVAPPKKSRKKLIAWLTVAGVAAFMGGLLGAKLGDDDINSSNSSKDTVMIIRTGP